jgi:diaminopimelate decarboxylase
MNVGGAFSKDGLSPKIIEDLKITKNNPLNYKVIAEPGRYFCSSSCYLLTRILAKRIKSGKPCYQINDSLYHAFNCILLDGISFENQRDLFYSKVVSTKN